MVGFEWQFLYIFPNTYLLNKSFYLHDHPCPAELEQEWPHGLFLVCSILFSQWDLSEGDQEEGKNVRSPSLMAQPARPSTSFPLPVLQLHPFPWKLPRPCLVRQPGDHLRMPWGTTWGPCGLPQAPC